MLKNVAVKGAEILQREKPSIVNEDVSIIQLKGFHPIIFFMVMETSKAPILN